MKISWKHTDTDLSSPPTLEEKVDVFYERIWGWQLHVADICLNGGTTHDGGATVPSIPHSGFASVQILLSYFETIAKYEDGFIPTTAAQGRSAHYFKRGAKSVFSHLAALNQADVDALLDALYKNARCGLYHMSQTKAGILLASGLPHALLFDATNKTLTIDPHQLPVILKKHLGDYRARLLDPKNVQLRDSFERRYDYDNTA